MLTFFQPVWLLLLIPLAAAWLAWPLPTRGLRVVRAVVLLLIVLALAQAAVRLPDRSGTLVVVADRSDSMPPQAMAAQLEAIELLQRAMRPRDQLAVISFGRNTVVEQPPQHGSFPGFTARVGTEHSDLNGAITAALSLIAPGSGGRLLLITDGKWTGKDPRAAAARSVGRGIPIDYRLLSRPQASDVAIEDFQVPDSTQPGQAYVISGWVRSPADREIQYELRRGPAVIAAGTRPVAAGLNRLMFRDRAAEPGVLEYTLSLRGAGDDPVPENNEARALVSVQGNRPLLALSAAGDGSGLVRLLKRGGIDVVARTPEQSQWSLETLAQFSGVLLENVPAARIGTSGMESLAAWVEETGSGLMLSGGQKSYGPGGYFHSPLDRMLPISMEMRREHRKLSLAIVVVLDRSGSMAMPAGGGRTKMDLANLGTVQVLDLLSPLDEIGVIAVDSSPHTIVPLNSVEINAAQRNRILSIDSMGGGIFIYEALAAASAEVLKANAQTRHIILFADAADSEEPGRYVELLEKAREAGLTVSVIGLGTEGDVDAGLLKDIAARGGGSCYFTDRPEEIPRLFAQDTFTVARSTFIEEPTPFKFTAGFAEISTPLSASPPPLGGYNLCYLRPEASLAAVTQDDYSAPVLAFWRVGSGRVLTYLGEADGKFSGEFAGWDQAGEFYASLARWTAGRREPLPAGQLLVQQVREGVCLVQLHLDPERKTDAFSRLPRLKVLHGLPGAAPLRQSLPFQWRSADLLEASFPVAGRETVLNTVEIEGIQPVTLPPVCLPYSPEFAPEAPGRGAAALAQLAAMTQGQERLELPRIWADLQSKPRLVDLSPWLLVAAACFFLTEIFQRRTGWFSRRLQSRFATEGTSDTPEKTTAEQAKTGRAWSLRRPKRVAPVKSAPGFQPAQGAPNSPQAPPAAPAPAGELDHGLEALREARARAERRTGRDR